MGRQVLGELEHGQELAGAAPAPSEAALELRRRLPRHARQPRTVRRRADRPAPQPVQPEVVAYDGQLLGESPLRLRALARRLVLLDERDLAVGEGQKPRPVPNEVLRQRPRDHAAGVVFRGLHERHDLVEIMGVVEVRRRLLRVIALGERGAEAGLELGPGVAEVPERPALRLGQVARRQPSGGVVLDVVEVDRPQRPVDADPGQERDPAIVLIGLNGLVSILVGLDLVAVRLRIRARRRDLGSVEKSDEPLGRGEVGELWPRLLVVREGVGDPLDGLVADPVGAEVHAVGRQPSLAPVGSARHRKPAQVE